jgi:hypothetical protein
VPREHVHQQLDPQYFLEYALFGGALRHYVAKSLEDAFRTDPNDLHRRFFVLGVFREEHAAYEDMGAILEALIRFRRGELQYPIEGVLRYKDDLVVLETLFRRRNITSADDLYDALGLSDFIPEDWALVHPNINCESALRRMCRFIHADCQGNQKRQGISAYNKLKHGLVLVQNGQRYGNGLPDAPAVLIQNPEPDSINPYAILAIQMTDISLKERCRVIEFVQSTLRAIAALYVLWRYPNDAMIQMDSKSVSWLFHTQSMVGIRDFMRQLCEKSELRSDS